MARPGSLEELAFLPVAHLSQLVRARKIKPSELTDMYLSRLKRYDPQLRCVITLTEARARAQARAADAEISAGKYRGPLHGIPWGPKDLLAAKGYKTTWGAGPYKEQVIDEDATVVQRLDRAGAILVAKPNSALTSRWLQLLGELAFAFGIGIPLALVLSRTTGTARGVMRALTTLPMVLPPVVGGVALWLAFGRRGLIGAPLYQLLGIQIPLPPSPSSSPRPLSRCRSS